MPRVVSRAVALVLGDGSQAELGRVRLADNDRSRLAKSPNVRRVVAGHPVAERVAAFGRSQALRRGQQILDADRYAAQGARIARAHPVGLRQRTLRHDGDESVDGRVRAFDLA